MIAVLGLGLAATGRRRRATDRLHRTRRHRGRERRQPHAAHPRPGRGSSRAADRARRRIERDPARRHPSNGWWRSVSRLRLAQSAVPSGLAQLQTQITEVADELTGAHRGAARDRPRHSPRRSCPRGGPGGRPCAHWSAAPRSPVELEIRAENPPCRPDRGGGPTMVVSEALTNVTKHAPGLLRASHGRAARRAAVPVDQRRRCRRCRSLGLVSGLIGPARPGCRPWTARSSSAAVPGRGRRSP